MEVSLEWSDFKTQLNKGLQFKYTDVGGNYYIYAADLPLIFTCILKKDGGSDQTDFETSYKPFALSTLNVLDYLAIPFEILTSTLATATGQSAPPVFSQFNDGTDRPYFTYKIYDNGNNEITTPGLANINLNNAVKTVVDFEPTFNYNIAGASLRLDSFINQTVRLWVVGVPDIPANLGGSVEIIGGVALNSLTSQIPYQMDGKTAKALIYNASTHTNKIRFIFKHPGGYQTKIYMVMQTHKI